MKINKKHKRGITLIELVIVISLIGIIGQTVYLTYFISNKSFTISKNKGFAQQDVRIVAEYINKELRFIELLSLEPLSGTYYSLELIENDNGRKSLVKKRYDKDGGSESIIFGNINKLFLENSLPGIITTNVTRKVDDQLYELEYNIDMVNGANLKTDIITSLDNNKLYYSFPKDKIIAEEQENEDYDNENDSNDNNENDNDGEELTIDDTNLNIDYVITKNTPIELMIPISGGIKPYKVDITITNNEFRLSETNLIGSNLPISEEKLRVKVITSNNGNATGNLIIKVTDFRPKSIAKEFNLTTKNK